VGNEDAREWLSIQREGTFRACRKRLSLKRRNFTGFAKEHRKRKANEKASRKYIQGRGGKSEKGVYRYLKIEKDYYKKKSKKL